MNDFSPSQFKLQADQARQQYEHVMQNIQAQARQYQESLRLPNIYGQQPIPPQAPVFSQQQPVVDPTPEQPPYTLQILSVLGDIKGLLMKAFPETPEVEAEVKVEEKPVKAKADEALKK